MKIPLKEYTLETFVEYIVNNLGKVFDDKKERKTLKVYLIYVAKDWKSVFSGLETTEMGDILRIRFTNPITERIDEVTTDFYIYQWEPGLVLMFTSSTKEEYERTLKNFIYSTKGISQSWIRPSLLNEMKNYLIHNYEARVYRFIARRYGHWKYPARIRPNYDRRLSYSGMDADQTLKEVQELYGMIPSSIDFRIKDWKIQINRNGLFLIRQINRDTLGILQELIERIVAEQVRIRNTSEMFNVQTRSITAGGHKIKIPRITAGRIILPNANLSQLMIEKMFRRSDSFEIGEMDREDEEIAEIENQFSYVDVYIKEGPLVYVATVIDEEKGTIFGISGSDKELTIIPKHRVTFESFIRFYDIVALNFDYDANLTLFSEGLLA